MPSKLHARLQQHVAAGNIFFVHVAPWLYLNLGVLRVRSSALCRIRWSGVWGLDAVRCVVAIVVPFRLDDGMHRIIWGGSEGLVACLLVLVGGTSIP